MDQRDSSVRSVRLDLRGLSRREQRDSARLLARRLCSGSHRHLRLRCDRPNGVSTRHQHEHLCQYSAWGGLDDHEQSNDYDDDSSDSVVASAITACLISRRRRHAALVRARRRSCPTTFRTFDSFNRRLSVSLIRVEPATPPTKKKLVGRRCRRSAPPRGLRVELHQHVSSAPTAEPRWAHSGPSTTVRIPFEIFASERSPFSRNRRWCKYLILPSIITPRRRRGRRSRSTRRPPRPPCASCRVPSPDRRRWPSARRARCQSA